MILCTFLNTRLAVSSGKELLWTVIIGGLMFGIYFTCSNVAHWMFCFEYYHTVRIMKYAHNDIPVPPEIN